MILAALLAIFGLPLLGWGFYSCQSNIVLTGVMLCIFAIIAFVVDIVEELNRIDEELEAEEWL